MLRLALFQISVGMAVTLITGTLNRVMILELSVPAWLVSIMVALPLLFAPLRALIGHKSDTHKSLLGWKRVPFIWFGTIFQFGGLAIMPMAILLMSVGGGPFFLGHIITGLGFLLIGLGLHTTQTAGLALATDLAPEEARPRVVALLYVMLLIGMVIGALGFSWLLADFSHQRLIQVIQGAAVVTIVLNMVALWKQEARNPAATAPHLDRPTFSEAWRAFTSTNRTGRLLLAVGLGTLAFSMQDILLEPYGGQVLGLSVSATTLLTALFAGGTLAGFALAAQRLGNNCDPYRYAGLGAVIGVVGFTLVVLSAPLQSAFMFRGATAMIGFGSGLFAVCLLTATMQLAKTTADGRSTNVSRSAHGCRQRNGGWPWPGGRWRTARPLHSHGKFGAFWPGHHRSSLWLWGCLPPGNRTALRNAHRLGPLVGAQRRATDTTTNRQGFGLAEFPG